MFNMEKFAQLLSGKRRDKGLSQGQLADLVGVTHQAVSKWERAEAMPEISKIGDIAKAIDTPADEIINTLYGNEKNSASVPEKGSADEAYLALADKTRVGDIYALAPNMSKEVLHSAVDTLISAKGAGSAAMLYQFCDREYLQALGNRLFALGDTSLGEYVDEATIKAAVVDSITNADICMDNNARNTYYSKAGQLLTFCKDAGFVNDMFGHMRSVFGRWDIWRNYIGKFPSEAVVKQGTHMMIYNGPNCFATWWDIIGRRNMAKIFLRYSEGFDKNNFQVWRDFANYYGYLDGSIVESAIKERLNDPEIDPQIFAPILRCVNPDLREILFKKGVRDNSNNNQSRNVSSRTNNRVKTDELIESMILNKINDELECADLDELPDVLSRIEKLRSGLGSTKNSGSEEMLVAIMEKLENIESRLDELDGRLDELESRIDDLE